MMTESERHELAKDLRKLVTGRMTNDDFDEVYYEKYCVSKDPAVREIARFGWSLYSSDLLIPYKLTGRHAITSGLKKRAAHAVLFLQTSQDYQYPLVVERPVCGLLAVLFAIAALIVLARYAFSPIGILVAFAFIALVVFTIAESDGKQVSNESSLDLRSSLWPFSSEENLADANGNAYMLGGFTKYETT